MGVETALMAGGAGLSVLGSISQGQEAKRWGKYQQKQAKADAQATLGAARVEQRKIREAATQQRASANTAIANSGVVVGDGTAADIVNRITQRSEYDVDMTMYNAQDEANRILAEGQAARIQGNQQAQAGYMQGFGSLLGLGAGLYSAYNKWQSSKPTEATGWLKSGLSKTAIGNFSYGASGATSGGGK